MAIPIRTLIVDDEPLARDSVRILLERDPRIEVVGECGSGRDALESIEELDPDLIFLDIEMPGMGGFELLASLPSEQVPRIVFVTAYDSYAVKAFEVNAVDYILKPFDDERFATALDRAKEGFDSAGPEDSYAGRLLQLLREDPVLRKIGSPEARQSSPAARGRIAGGPAAGERIAIRESGRIYFVDIDAIDWIGGAGNHAELHTGTESHLHRESLSSLEERLDPGTFLRIHRSTIVRIDRVSELRPRARGDYDVVLKDGTTLVLSRRYHDRLDRLIGD